MNLGSLDQFLAACGSSEPLRLGVGQRDELGSETWSFQQPFLVIGRRPESDLVLDHWQVSRRHAYLQLIEGRYYCVDLGSRTGTHGGDSTERSGWLDRGKAIQIGPFAVRPEWPPTVPRASSATPNVTWELPGRAIGQSLWRMDRHLALVGRSPACKIRIVEADVSKFHCSVVLTPMGAWVVDLLGQNGILVNDQPIRCARLEDGDELRIGRHILRARYDSPPAALPRVDPSTAPTISGVPTRLEASFPARIARPGEDLPARMFPPALADPANAPLATVGALDPSVNLLVHQFGMMQQQMFDQFHQTMLMMFEGFASLHREQASTIREEFDRVRQLSDEIESLRVETARLAKAAEDRPASRPEPRPVDRPRPAANGHTGPTPAADPLPPIKRPSIPLPDPDADIHAQLCLRLSTIENERQNRWQKILGMMSNRS